MKKMYTYIFLLLIVAISLTSINIYLEYRFINTHLYYFLIIVFSALNIVSFLKPIPIIDEDKEKAIGMDFFINIFSLLVGGYIVAIISSIAGSSYYIIRKHILKNNYKNIHRPIVSLLSIIISVNAMNSIYFLLGGHYSVSLQISDIFIILIASLSNALINGFLLAIAFNIDLKKRLKDIVSTFHFYFFWTYKYFIWDSIYAFLVSIVMVSILVQHNFISYISSIFFIIILYYPVKERINSFELNVKYNKQNKDLILFNEKLEKTNEIVVEAFLASLEAKDSYTKEHSQRVSNYATILAKEFNFTNEEIKIIGLAGLLHDIGKIKVNENILNKNGKLTDEEYEEIKNHSIYGLGILEKMYKDKETNIAGKEFQIIANIASMHHERFDGRGYPYKKQGEEIPLEARILGVVDTFDAMTTTRSYRKALSIEDAYEEIKRNMGTQFCPTVASKFLELIDNGIIHL